MIWLVSRTGERFLQALRERVFRHLMGLSMDFYEREKTGRLVSRMTSDIDALQELISQGLVMFIQNILIFFGALIVIFIMSWQLALCTLVIVPPVMCASRWFRRESNRAYLEVRERIGQNLATLQEGLEGVRVVQAFGRERGWIRRFHEHERGAVRRQPRDRPHLGPVLPVRRVRRRRSGSRSSSASGGIFVDQGIITVGTVLAFVLYLNSLFEPIQQLSQLYNTVQSAGAALHKVFALLDTEGTVGEKPGAVDLPERGAIEVDNVAFAYGGGPPDTAGESHPVGPMVLRDVSLTVAAGRAGRARRPHRRGEVDAGQADGALLRPGRGRGALRRRRPARRDDEQPARADRRRAAGGLPLRGHGARQHPGRPRRSDRRGGRGGGRRARPARRSSVRSPTVSTPRCASAARGCRRGRSSSCRWRAPRSPTPRCSCSTKRRRTSTPAPSGWSSAALETLTEGRTVVVVAHRLSTAARCDRIAVVDDGRLMEVGTHDELLERRGRYSRLFAAWDSGQPMDRSA